MRLSASQSFNFFGPFVAAFVLGVTPVRHPGTKTLSTLPSKRISRQQRINKKRKLERRKNHMKIKTNVKRRITANTTNGNRPQVASQVKAGK